MSRLSIKLEDTNKLVDRIATAIARVDRVEFSQASPDDQARYTLQAVAAFSTIAWAPEWSQTSDDGYMRTGTWQQMQAEQNL